MSIDGRLDCDLTASPLLEGETNGQFGRSDHFLGCPSLTHPHTAVYPALSFAGDDRGSGVGCDCPMLVPMRD